MCENFQTYSLCYFFSNSDKDQIVGCSTPAHPTKRFIQGHKYLYMKYGDTVPLLDVQHGGGICEQDSDCGKNGKCESGPHKREKECVCQTHEYTGPHCLVSTSHTM